MLVQRLHDFIDGLSDQLQDRGQMWAVFGVAAALVIAAVWLHGSMQPAPVLVRRAGTEARASPAAETTSTEATIAVHIGGCVRRAGMVWLPRGARINDAVRLAGGTVAGADLDAINLASRMTDGQQVVVPRRGQAQQAGPPGVADSGGSAASAAPGASGADGGTVDINTATVAQFDGLPGIGPVLAQRLFDYRNERGRFRRVEDLQQVEGIGPKKFAQLRSCVTCTP